MAITFGPQTGLPPTGAPTTTDAATLRTTIATARRIVVKIGSSSLTTPDYRVASERIDGLADALQRRMARGSDVLLVSSGAVAAGMDPLSLKRRPKDQATTQAAAAVGQALLAQEWARSFARYSRTTAQVLLTASDAADRSRARNIQRTVDRLRQLGVLPIINENDTVATSEYRFGDNDRLSAIVANLMGADALVLLTDVEGLYDKNPADPTARFIPEVFSRDDMDGVVAGSGSGVGTGGMATKINAVRLASHGGIPVLLTSAANIDAALGDASVGTAFAPRSGGLSAWKFWVLYAADATGSVQLDAGAARAISAGGNSLLPVGITGLDGEFHSGEVVELHGPDGKTIGRGEVAYDSHTLQSMLGKKTDELPEGLRRPAVHADYLSIYSSSHV